MGWPYEAALIAPVSDIEAALDAHQHAETRRFDALGAMLGVKKKDKAENGLPMDEAMTDERRKVVAAGIRAAFSGRSVKEAMPHG